MDQFKGVYPRGDSIRIQIRYKTKKYSGTLKLKPNPSNLAHAARVREQMLFDLRTDQYNPEKYFNTSGAAPSPAQPQAPIITFHEMAYRWVTSQSHLSEGTLRQYKLSLRRVWLPLFADRDITQIKYSELAQAVGKIKWTSAKTRNNNLITLRKVFEMAYLDELIDNNPTERIANQKVQHEQPDPFDLDEIEQILDYMDALYDPQISNYFEFAFFTGLRPEEQIELKWTDYDQQQKQIRIQRAKSYGTVKNVKNNKIRDIDLNDRAVQAINKQKAYTFLKSEYIFLNPNTEKQWADQAKQRTRYWVPTIKRLAIRYRPPYQARHSYATMLLMSGVNPAYAANQMGHSVQVFFNVYARWITRQDQQREQEKLSKFLDKAPKKPQNKTNLPK